MCLAFFPFDDWVWVPFWTCWRALPRVPVAPDTARDGDGRQRWAVGAIFGRAGERSHECKCLSIRTGRSGTAMEDDVRKRGGKAMGCLDLAALLDGPSTTQHAHSAMRDRLLLLRGVLTWQLHSRRDGTNLPAPKTVRARNAKFCDQCAGRRIAFAHGRGEKRRMQIQTREIIKQI